jgi:hypothetical protein
MADRRPTWPSGPRLTRRRLVLAGTAAIVAAAGVQYGRFGQGTEFEVHVAKTLGISVAAASRLLAGARGRLGDGAYDLRAAAFLSVTTLPGSLLPAGVRERGIGPLVYPMLEDHADALVLLGLREPGPRSCAGLAP